MFILHSKLSSYFLVPTVIHIMESDLIFLNFNYILSHSGGAVALDGRIEPGDMILQVNEISFENMSNDEAVRVLREVVQKPG